MCSEELTPVMPEPRLSIEAEAVRPSCKKCGRAYDEGVWYCLRCGAPRESADLADQVSIGRESARAGVLAQSESYETEPAPLETCMNCGSELEPGMNYCEACGAPNGAKAAIRQEERKWKRALIAFWVTVLPIAIAFWYFWGVRVIVVSNPPGARILIDGKEMGTTDPKEGQLIIPHLRRGSYLLRASLDQHEDSMMPFQLGVVDFSSLIEVKMNLSAFSLSLISVPQSCKVLIDGKEVGATNEKEGKLVLNSIKKGNHTLIVRREGFQDKTLTVNLDSPQALAVELTILAGGKWKGSYISTEPQTNRQQEFTLEIEQDGNTISGLYNEIQNTPAPYVPYPGSLTNPDEADKSIKINGTVSGRNISFTKRNEEGDAMQFTGTVGWSGDKCFGSWTAKNCSGTWVMSRIPAQSRGY